MKWNYFEIKGNNNKGKEEIIYLYGTSKKMISEQAFDKKGIEVATKEDIKELKFSEVTALLEIRDMSDLRKQGKEYLKSKTKEGK